MENEEPVTRRRKILQIDSGFLPVIFGRDGRSSYEVTKGGLPPDATIVAVKMSPDNRTLILTLESREFGPATEPYPEIDMRFNWIYPVSFRTVEPSTN